METAPMNSQSSSSSQQQHHHQHQQKPLHNFSLSFLKWGNNNIHTSRRSVDSSPPPQPPSTEHHHTRRRSSDTEQPSGETPVPPLKNNSHPEHVQLGSSRSGRTRFNFSSLSVLDKDKTPKEEVVEKESEEEEEEEEKKKVEKEEEPQKPWNLRPRKNVNKNGFEFGYGAVSYCGNTSNKNGDLQDKEIEQQGENAYGPKSSRLRGLAAEAQEEKKKKKKEKEKSRFWISLSKEEIEEDIFAMTGSKPSRRPKKRSKAVQKQLDSVFPGLWLVGTTPDSYRLPDTPPKK